MSTSPLITVEELRDRLGSAEPPVLLDVRWQLGGPPGHDSYLTGHLPGAVYVDLDTELAAAPRPQWGRHPLPEIDALQEAARRWGISDGNAVVAYDANGGMSAARAWWLLRWAGLSDVRVLDGGLDAWRSTGGPIGTDDVEPSPGDVVLAAGALPVVDADEVAAMASEGIVLDARAAERYRGEVEPVDPRAGHIPGARSAPTADNLNSEGLFRPPAELAQRFADLGVRPDEPVAVYCGSGVTAAHEILALEVAGHSAVL